MGIGIDTYRGSVQDYPHGRGSVSIRIADRYRIIPTDGDRCRYVSRIGTGLSPRTGIGGDTYRGSVQDYPHGRGSVLIRIAERYGIMKSSGAPVANHYSRKRLALGLRDSSRPEVLLWIRSGGYKERIARSAWSYPWKSLVRSQGLL